MRASEAPDANETVHGSMRARRTAANRRVPAISACHWQGGLGNLAISSVHSTASSTRTARRYSCTLLAGPWAMNLMFRIDHWRTLRRRNRAGSSLIAVAAHSYFRT